MSAVLDSGLNGSVAWGKRLLPIVLDSIAREAPDRSYASVTFGSDLKMGFKNVTFKEMAKAIDGFGHTLHVQFGRSHKFETLCYLGPP